MGLQFSAIDIYQSQCRSCEYGLQNVIIVVYNGLNVCCLMCALSEFIQSVNCDIYSCYSTQPLLNSEEVKFFCDMPYCCHSIIYLIHPVMLSWASVYIKKVVYLLCDCYIIQNSKDSILDRIYASPSTATKFHKSKASSFLIVLLTSIQNNKPLGTSSRLSAGLWNIPGLSLTSGQWAGEVGGRRLSTLGSLCLAWANFTTTQTTLSVQHSLCQQASCMPTGQEVCVCVCLWQR